MKISVVIPTYNYARYICEAIDSVLCQTFPAHEVIVVDDGSTDDTADRVAMYGDKVHYIFQQNRGLSAARNAGLATATGDAIALLDSDDAFHPLKLQYQSTYLDAHPAVGLVGTRIRSNSRTEWDEVHVPTATVLPLESHVMRTQFCPSSAMFRRSLVEQVGGFDPAVNAAADRDYWIRCASRSLVAKLESPLTFYRIHATAMSRNADLMVLHERAVLDKAFYTPELRHRICLRRRAYGFASLSAAYMYLREAGQPVPATRAYLQSFVQWPLPFSRRETKRAMYRLRFGIRMAIDVLTRRAF